MILCVTDYGATFLDVFGMFEPCDVCFSQAFPPNWSRTARRLVQVACPASESICQDTDGFLSCSFGGICGMGMAGAATAATSVSGMAATGGGGQAGEGDGLGGAPSILPSVALPRAASALGASGVSNLGSGASLSSGSSAGSGFGVWNVGSSSMPPMVPVLRLIGPGTVVVPYGSMYIKCQGGMVSGCDQGVQAVSSGGAAPGADLSSQVWGGVWR